MQSKTLLSKLFICAATAILLILLQYLWIGGNPLHRLGYSIFLAVTPLLAALLLARFIKARLSWSWMQTVGIYLALFILTKVIQHYGRRIPVYQIVHNFTLNQ